MRVFGATNTGRRLTNRIGIAEMVTYLPISSPFIRFAGRFVDEAFGVRPRRIPTVDGLTSL